MLGDREFGWVEEQMRDRSPASTTSCSARRCRGCSPTRSATCRAINQIAANRPGWRGRLAETIRQGADLEHWQAFHDSFDRLTRLIARAATGDPGAAAGDGQRALRRRPPQLRRPVDLPGIASNETDVGAAARPPAHLLPRAQQGPLVHQARVPAGLVPPPRARSPSRWSRRAGVHAGTPCTWTKLAGPLFGNMIATLELDDRRATVWFEQPRTAASLTELARLTLTPPPDPGDPVPERRHRAQIGRGEP